MLCPRCGAENSSSNRSCRMCGAALKRPVAAGEAPNAWSPSNAIIQPQVTPTFSDIYAGFWARVASYIIDYLVMVVFSFALGSVLGDQMGLLATFIAVVLYDILMVSSPLQGTLGKLALGLKVTDLQGRRVSLGRSIGRFFAEWLTALTIGIGYLMAAFTERRQTLHDKIASTLVVRKSAEEDAIVIAGPAAPMSVGSIVAVVLLVLVVPFTGMLAAIAIPAYQDYTIRAQVAEGLELAAAHREAVSEVWHTRSLAFDDIDSSVLPPAVPSSGPHVESIQVHSGAVVITFGSRAAPQLQGRVLALIPAVDGELTHLVWVCGYASPRPGFEAIFREPAEYSDVPPKYLPSACRAREGS